MTFPVNIPATYAPPSVVETTPSGTFTGPVSSSTYAMQGLGALFTPGTPIANVLAIVSATLHDSATTDGEGISLQLYYGPMVAGVAAPANAAVVPAGAIPLGPVVTYENAVTLTTAAHLNIPITLAGLAKSLVQGQQYWFDVAAIYITGSGVVTLTAPNIILVEIA